MAKKILHILAAAVLVLSSCSKDFVEQTNPNAVSVDQNYQTENDVKNGVLGVYQALRSSNCIGEGAQLWTDDRSDDINSTDNQSNNGEPFQFTSFSLVPSNTWLRNHWAALYEPISRANIMLEAIEHVSFSDNSLKTQYIAEVKFLRALMYYNLVKEFGGVPLITERLTGLDEIAAKTLRSSPGDVYAQIVTDLKDAAASDLPEVQPVAEKGRVSLQAVNALLGKVYLTMGLTLDDGKKNEHLENAKSALLACYNMKTFNKLSDISFPDVFDVTKKHTNPEIIFQIVYKQGDVNYSSSLARSNQARGETINSLFASQGNGGLFSLDLLKEFEEGDIRTSFSIKKANDPLLAHFITKFRDNSAGATNLGYGGNDWILIRYADVILNLAEVYMHSGEEIKAVEYLNMVRERAGVPDYQTMKADPDYSARYPTLKLAILHERRVELAFEHHRWHDLTRFFDPEELVAYFKAKNQADFDNSPLSNITTKDYYFPIPLNEQQLNPEGMHQNPGY